MKLVDVGEEGELTGSKELGCKHVDEAARSVGWQHAVSDNRELGFDTWCVGVAIGKFNYYRV